MPTLLTAILVYLVLMALVLYMRPQTMFNDDGTYKEFGVGIPGRTVFPVWLVATAGAAVSYIAAIMIEKFIVGGAHMPNIRQHGGAETFSAADVIQLQPMNPGAPTRGGYWIPSQY